MKKQSEEFQYSFQIRECHLDTLGHVNNATYLVIFEEARWDLIGQRGFGLKEVHQKQVSPIILEINIKFKREVRNRERITIKTQCVKYEGKVGVLKQTMLTEKNEEASTAEFVFGLFDMKTRKLIPPTDEWLNAIGML